jgi:nitroreductase
MELYEAIRTRRSIRSYQDKPVPENVLRRILEAGRLAPSARNRQEWRYIVVRDPETRARLSVAAKGQPFVAEAPVVLVACALESGYVMTCGQPSHLIDVAISLEHIALAATAEGLGTCWVGAFFQDQVKEILGIPDEIEVVELMPLGFPAETPTARNRKAFDEAFVFDRWA